MKKIMIAVVCLSVLLVGLMGSPVLAVSPGNKSHDMPAYYDDQIFKISFMELPAGGEKANDMRNGSINKIYQYDPGLPGGVPFISVIDAIQGDGFNPLWEEFQIVFNDGTPATAGFIAPKQYTRDDNIVNDFLAGKIGLTETDEVYICTVFGPKKK